LVAEEGNFEATIGQEFYERAEILTLLCPKFIPHGWMVWMQTSHSPFWGYQSCGIHNTLFGLPFLICGLIKDYNTKTGTSYQFSPRLTSETDAPVLLLHGVSNLTSSSVKTMNTTFLKTNEN
jgi:hypothetical protein